MTKEAKQNNIPFLFTGLYAKTSSSLADQPIEDLNFYLNVSINETSKNDQNSRT